MKIINITDIFILTRYFYTHLIILYILFIKYIKNLDDIIA